MAFNLTKTITNLFTKSQKAQYVVSNDPRASEQGQPVPMQYSPEVRIKLYKTPIVFMAINTIADQVAKVDWEIVPKKPLLDQFGRGQNEGKSSNVLTRKEYSQFVRKYSGQDRQNVSDTTKEHIQKVYNLLSDPNENQENFSSIVKKIAIDLKIHDAAALEKTRNGLNEIAEIYTAPGAYIRMNFDKNGKLGDPAYYQQDPKMSTNKVANWKKDELIYYMLNPISTSMYGVSPLDVIAQIVATLINALNYNGSYFESAALPEGYFTIPNMTQDQARRLMQKWEQEIKSKPHKVIFMPEGATWHQFRFTNVEMQWLQGQKFYMELVMAALGVTKHELGFTEDVNRATADNQSFVFKNKSLLPILGLLADKFNQELIGKSGFGYDDVMFIFKNVDLADKETMDKIHDRAIKSGRMTINEAREESGLHPYDNFGDEPVIATSQGLVFLQQYDMQFKEYQEEQDWLKAEAAKKKIPVAELRRQISAAKTNEQNNPGNPKAPPKAPKADEKPNVDESKPQEKSFAAVDGLRELTKTIESALKEDNDKQRKAPKSVESDKSLSDKTKE
jgi:HK97 family phage portal protein